MRSSIKMKIKTSKIFYVVLCFIFLSACKTFTENTISGGNQSSSNNPTKDPIGGMPAPKNPENSDPTPASLAVNPASFIFTNTMLGSTSLAQSFVFSNSGQVAASGCTAAALGGNNPAEFAMGASSCSATLAAGGSCTVMVAAKPLSTTILKKTASLNLSCNSGNLSQSVAMSYTASAVSTNDCPSQVLANTYYISAAGNDNNAGTCAAPWQSISKLNSFMAGSNVIDSILFKRSETFVGSILIGKSGTNSKPIVIGAYGSGVKPVITGFANVSGWTEVNTLGISTPGTKIWQSNNAVSTSSELNMILINGVNTPYGRVPRTGYWTASSAAGTSITDGSHLNASTTNWKDANVVMRTAAWHLDRSVISSASGSTINFPKPDYAPQANWGYSYKIIQQHLRKLQLNKTTGHILQVPKK